MVKAKESSRSRIPSYASADLPDVDGGVIRPQAAPAGPQALPARAHARAAIPLQPGLRRLRQSPIPRPHSENESLARRLLPGRRRVRRADGLHPRRRAFAAPADRRNRGRSGGAQEVRLPLHQRAPANRKNRPLYALEVPYILRAHGRPEGASRFLGVQGRRLRTGPRGHPRSRPARLPRHDQHDPVRRRRPQ